MNVQFYQCVISLKIMAEYTYFLIGSLKCMVNSIRYEWHRKLFHDSKYLIFQDTFYALIPHYLKTLSVSVGLYNKPAKQLPSADIQHLHSVLCDGSCDMIPIKSLVCTLQMCPEY